MPVSSVNINLLSDRKKLLKRRRLLVAKIQLLSGVVLAVYVAILLVVVSFRISVSARLGKIDEGIKDETYRIVQLQQREAVYTVVSNKASLANDLLENRVSLKKEFERVVSMLPDNSSLNNFEVKDDNKSIGIQVKTESAFVMVDLLNVFEEYVDQQEYEFVSVESFSRSEDGTYQLQSTLPI